jgi:hypothetical protein
MRVVTGSPQRRRGFVDPVGFMAGKVGLEKVCKEKAATGDSCSVGVAFLQITAYIENA